MRADARRIPLYLLAALLVWGVLALWAPQRWVRGLEEVGLYALAAWLLARGRLGWDWRLAVLGFAALWPHVQRAAGWTVYGQPTLDAALFWAAAAAAYFAASKLAPEIGTTRLRRALAWFGGGLALVAVVQFYTSAGRVYWLFDSGYRDEVLGPFVYRNNYAAFIELLLPMALYETFAGSRRRSAWFAGCAAMMYASVVASASRAGTLLVTAEAVVVIAACVWRARGGRGPAVNPLRLVLLTALLSAVAGSSLLWNRLQEKDPLALRRTYNQASIEMARQRPWTGFGLGNWPHVYPAYARTDNGQFANRAHNDWAEWAVEGGAPFAAAMLALAAGALAPAVASVWGVGLVSVCLHALVDYPFARPGQALWWFAVLGAVTARRRRSQTDDLRRVMRFQGIAGVHDQPGIGD